MKSTALNKMLEISIQNHTTPRTKIMASRAILKRLINND